MTERVDANDEDADALSPPDASMRKRVLDAKSWIWNGIPVWPSNVFKVRRSDTVEVATMVTVDVPDGDEVPNAEFPSSLITKSFVLNERNPVTAMSVFEASNIIEGSETISSPLMSSVVPASVVNVPDV